MNINRLTILVICLICVMLTVMALPCSAENSTQKPYTGAGELSVDIYADYLGKWENPAFPDNDVFVISSNEGENLFKEKDVFSKNVTVDNAGLYALNITYKSQKGSAEETSFSLSINGNIPYFEASSISLPKIYCDDFSDFDGEILTAEAIPEQIEIEEYRSYFCFDTIGYYGGMLYFYLKAGENSITLDFKSGAAYIREIKFTHYTEAPSYATAKKDLKAKEYSAKSLTFECENIQYKSNTSILAINDASSAAVSPSDPKIKLMNAVGGTNWQEAGQYIEWKFTVPEDGLYNITLKYRQENNVGMNSYRRILIDGIVPYSELEEYAFAYSSTFTKETLSDGEEPMLFELKAGEHTLKMQVVIGQLSDLLPYVNKVVNQLTEDYRKIIMITGTKPDTLRDYFLETSIPETLESLETQKKEIDRLWKLLESFTSSSSSGSKALGALSEQLSEFSKDSYNITQNLPSFKSNISSLCNWLLEAKMQPLKFDYFVCSAPKTKETKNDGNFWQSILFNIKSFLFTFSSEYEGNSLGSNEKDTITVWVTGSSAKYNILHRFIRSDFEKKNPDIKVDLKLVTATAKLANSIVAEKNPDIALEQESTAIMNLVFRNAVTDISRFSDGDEVLSQFRETSLIPVSYKNKVYAMPSTQTFSALYYRTDIFTEMELEPPKTWEDVIYILSELKKNNLEFGIPHNLDTFVSMLYQAGGKMYNDKETATALNSREAIESFTKFTGFFTDYSAPLAFNELNRFRTGEMPILIGNINFYNMLKVLAPEIDGRWDVVIYPGTADAQNNISNLQMATVKGDVILNEDKAEICWKFLKWKATDEIQVALSENYEMALGRSERLMTANKSAFSKLGWSAEMLELIEKSENNLCAIPSVPGSYYLTRHINNAISRVIYDSDVPGDALLKYAAIIDSEIAYKTEWFGLE